MGRTRSAAKDIGAILADIEAEVRAENDWGNVASYIPELADIRPNQFAMSVCTAAGETVSTGDAMTRFSIQSVSKVFTLALALGRHGDLLWRRVGKEPSGNPFNSIIQLEVENGTPRNPFVNAGAIVTTDAILEGRKPRDTLAEILRFIRSAAEDDDIWINDRVARSEERTGDRNYAIAHFLRSCGNLRGECALVLGTYFHHCAIEMTCVQLARAGRFLCSAFGDQRLIPTERVRSINALMMTCGHYDGSGEFAYRVGFPGKSGVGGGILAVVPNVASIAVWSPGLNDFGNSKQGTRALERLSERTGWSVFA
ncbi:glutaminase [Limibaculum sp. M0105]|uniref:Glutaminase n=1 Tax=Thermohalobaculum xanthum TaxID=2753746 RepID=A0A8J7SA80_9RHOB|nr:glutaminase [Thermohalobaculum xanthum]MBK0398177.1 glutaminase [Thermohalobaculum xanthum]